MKAVDYLSGVLHDGIDQDWEVGPLGHALHALAIYDGRVFKPLDREAEEEENVASGRVPEYAPDVVLSDRAPSATRKTAPRRTTRA